MSAGKFIIDHGGEENIESAEVHPKLCEYLERLLATGLYGHNAADVAVRLVEEGVRKSISQGIIEVLE